MMQIQDLSGMSNNEIVEMAAELLATGSRKYDEDVGIAEAFIRKEERVDKDVRTILWVKKNNKEEYLYYTFNSEQQEFKSLDKETVEELLASGMLEFYKGQKLPGFEEWISEKEYKQLRNFEQDR